MSWNVDREEMVAVTKAEYEVSGTAAADDNTGTAGLETWRFHIGIAINFQDMSAGGGDCVGLTTDNEGKEWTGSERPGNIVVDPRTATISTVNNQVPLIQHSGSGGARRGGGYDVSPPRPRGFILTWRCRRRIDWPL